MAPPPPPPDIVEKLRTPLPLVTRACPLLPSAVGWLIPSITTLPEPLGVTDIFPFAPSAIVTVPEFVPELVLKVKSPVHCVVIVELALFSPTITVSAPKLTSPVP